MGIVLGGKVVTWAGRGVPPGGAQNHHSSVPRLALFPASFSRPSFGDAAARFSEIALK